MSITVLLITSGQAQFNKTTEETPQDRFLTIAKEFSKEHSYDLEHYNCVNYSNDLYELVKNLNITIKKIRGCPPIESEGGVCHRFLRLEIDGKQLDFEPIYAEFRDYSKQFPDQIEVTW